MKREQSGIQQQNVKLLIDSREPKHIFYRLKEKNIDCKITKLEVGDYIIGKTVIERKTITDFMNSIFNKRIWKQVYELSKHEEVNKILAIIGYPSTIDYPILFGAISSIVTGFKINVILLPGEDQFISLLNALWRRVVSKREISRPIYKLKAETTDDEKINMLSQIKGVSLKRAKVLLELGGSILGIPKLKDEQVKHAGIPLSVFRHVKTVLTEKFGGDS